MGVYIVMLEVIIMRKQTILAALELLNAYEFGVCCTITKSNLVTRDADILEDIIENAPASVNFSITCSDDETCRKIEPMCPQQPKI